MFEWAVLRDGERIAAASNDACVLTVFVRGILRDEFAENIFPRLGMLLVGQSGQVLVSTSYGHVSRFVTGSGGVTVPPSAAHHRHSLFSIARVTDNLQPENAK